MLANDRQYNEKSPSFWGRWLRRNPQPPTALPDLAISKEARRRGSALTLNGQAVDLSYFYDGFTVYSKVSEQIADLNSCLDKCEKLDFILPNPTRDKTKNLQIKTNRERARACVSRVHSIKGEARFQRAVHRNDYDHDLYHQDHFVMDRHHYHLKFNRVITQRQFIQIIDVFAEEKLITKEEKASYIDAFNFRYASARAALNAVCVPVEKRVAFLDRRRRDFQALLMFINTCRNNDVLVNLHDYLLEQRFDHLRVVTEVDPVKEWQGLDRSGAVVRTSETWAKLEKALSLQLIKNLLNQASHFTRDFAAERCRQLADSHLFFRIKRSRQPAAPDGPRTYKTLEAFYSADCATLARKYNKLFSVSS